MSPGRKAVFLDRDGTIVRELEALREARQVELLPGVVRGLELLQGAGYALVIVTNQSGIARGLYGEEELRSVHARLLELLAERGIRIAGIFYCPHHPSEGRAPWRTQCDCRKPRPGLLQRAIAALDLETAGSWIIGDAERDLAAAAALAIPGILVATGKGERERARLAAAGHAPARYVPDLEAAARLVLAQASV